MSHTVNFHEIIPKLSEATLSAVEKMGFETLTPVQAAAIPLFLSHKDVLCEAVTGSGKTLAFGIPIFEMLSRADIKLHKNDFGALVIAPTRELANQIFEVFQILSEYHQKYRCTLCVGGTSVTDELKFLTETGAQIMIGTPGRILDIYKRSEGLINFKSLEVLVLDEADTLLDMGFRNSINEIFGILPKQRRTGLFSATQTKEIKELARAGMRNPVSITVKVQHNLTQKTSKMTSQSTPVTLQNYYIISEYEDRIKQLYQFILNHSHEKIIIFCATCACVDFYGKVFHEHFQQHPEMKMNNITTFHGKMVPKKRNALYNKFQAWPHGVMFSTDVAARGIDIPDIDWIIQLTAPKDPSFFVHRVGRTARAGKKGQAIVFLTEEESAYVEFLRGRNIPLVEYTAESLMPTATEAAAGTSILDDFKRYASHDRDILEAGSTAFISFLRAYKENQCSFIFQMEKLDIGSLARSYSLLRLPKIPETRGIRGGKPINFEKSTIETGKIQYKQKEKEKARIRKLQVKINGQVLEEDLAVLDDDKISMKTFKSEKKPWIPPEQYVAPEEPKRNRKKKQSFTQKMESEWDELAGEEQLYKKFKKGKITKKEYDEKLMSINDSDDDDDDNKKGKGNTNKNHESDSGGDDDSDDE